MLWRIIALSVLVLFRSPAVVSRTIFMRSRVRHTGVAVHGFLAFLHHHASRRLLVSVMRASQLGHLGAASVRAVGGRASLNLPSSGNSSAVPSGVITLAVALCVSMFSLEESGLNKARKQRYRALSARPQLGLKVGDKRNCFCTA